MTPVRKNTRGWLVILAFICASLMAAEARAATKDSGRTRVTIQHGVVVGMRWIPPDATTLGASADVMGRVSCGAARIKRTPIFRVETASQYFDLSKLCGSGAAEYWRDYEHLPIGEQVTFRIVESIERSSSSKCRDIAMGQMLQGNLDPFHTKYYESHCTYKVTSAFVEHGNAGVWDFRVVGSGAISKAETAQDSGAWVHFQRGVVTAIGWTKDQRSLVGPELTTDHFGQLSCNGNPIQRMLVYRIEASSSYFDLEEACDEPDLMGAGRGEEWGEDPSIEIGQQITFYTEKNPDRESTKPDSAKEIAWVNQGDRVLEFSVAGSALKSALPQGPPFANPYSGGSSYNKCGAGVIYPTAIYKPDPPYSEQARGANKQGNVIVSFVVDAQGNIVEGKVIKSLGAGPDESSLRTLKTWKFRPATCHGTPIPMQLEVRFDFR